MNYYTIFNRVFIRSMCVTLRALAAPASSFSISLFSLLFATLLLLLQVIELANSNLTYYRRQLVRRSIT